MASKRERAADWLDGFAAGYRIRPMSVPSGCRSIESWLAGWLDGRELQRTLTVSIKPYFGELT